MPMPVCSIMRGRSSMYSSSSTWPGVAALRPLTVLKAAGGLTNKRRGQQVRGQQHEPLGVITQLAKQNVVQQAANSWLAASSSQASLT